MLYDDFQPVPASHITIAEHSAVIAESKIKSECALEEKLSIFLVFSVCCTVTLTKSFPPSSCQCKNQSTELEKKKKNVPFLVQIVSTAVCLCVTTLSSLSRSSHTHTHTWLGKKKRHGVCMRSSFGAYTEARCVHTSAPASGEKPSESISVTADGLRVRHTKTVRADSFFKAQHVRSSFSKIACFSF